MKTYVVRKKGYVVGHVQAKNLRQAEAVAKRKYGQGASVAIS